MGDSDRLALLSDMPGNNGADRAVMQAHRSFRARQMARPGGTAPRRQDRLFHALPCNTNRKPLCHGLCRSWEGNHGQA
jgi:hypothetical protein